MACHHCGFGLTGMSVIPPSPVKELLHSNSIPSPVQEQAINDVLTAVESDMSRLDEEIARINFVMKQLQTERLSLQTYVDDHKALLTPARRLFPELWAEIFLRCSKGSVRKRLPEVLDSFDPKRGPLLLTQICSSWRSIALSTPELWTLIRVPVRRSKESQLSLIDMWLERSGTCPLTIAISERITSSDRVLPPLEWIDNPAIHVLIEQSHRWKDAYFMLPPFPTLWESFSAIRGNMPLLQTLLINVSYGSYSHRPDIITNVFEFAPQLKALTLDYGTPLSLMKMPLKQLCYLRMSMHRETPPTINMCLEAISLLPNLEECLLHCGGAEPWNPMVASVHHSRLQKLIIMVESQKESNIERGLPSLFNRMTLPSLRTLIVRPAFPDTRGWDHHSFAHFLSRSPELEALTLLVPLPADELIETLRETPKLTRLYFRPHSTSFVGILSELLLGNLKRSHGSPLLLNLRIIEIEVDSQALPTLFIDNVDVLRQRTAQVHLHQVARLEYVALYCSNVKNRFELSDEAKQEMITLAQGGLSIRIYNDFTPTPGMPVKTSPTAALMFSSEHFYQQGTSPSES